MTTPSIRRARRWSGALVAVLAASTALAGCASEASTVPEKQAQPILTEKSVVQVWKDYDRANSAAMPAAGPPAYDGTAYDDVDAGPLRAQNLASAKLRKITGDKSSKPFTTTSEALYAPLEEAGFALSTTRIDDESPQLNSLVRVGGPAGWKQEMSVGLARPRDVPGPLAPGKSSTADAADLERARTTVGGVTEFWSTLRRPSGVRLGDAARTDFVKSLRQDRTSKLDFEVSVDVGKPYPTGEGAGDAFRVVRAKGGLLVLACFPVRERFEGHGGVTSTRKGDFGKLLGTKPKKKYDVVWISTLAVSIPDEGPARVLGVSVIPRVR